METRNPKKTESGAIDCEINHPKYGWIPFTASLDDVEQLGRDVYNLAVSSAAPYVAPAAIPLSAKQLRDSALLSLTHDFGDGRIIQTRPQDEQNVKTAIELMTSLSMASIDWVMADNVKHHVTVEELQAALLAGQLAAMQVWADYEP